MAKKKSVGSRTTKAAAKSAASERKTTGRELKKKGTAAERRPKPSGTTAKASSSDSTRKRPKKVSDYIRAKRAYNRFGEQLKKLPGVSGLSIGPRFKDDRKMREMVLRLHVSTDEQKKWLKENADKVGYRKLYGGVDTDIVVWNFTTSAAAKPAGRKFPDGTAIESKGGRGTLGTTVIIKIGGKRTGVWLTAGHVVSIPIAIAVDSVDVSLFGGGLIGTVAKGHYLRDADLDVAFINPTDPIGTQTPSRTIAPLTASDGGATVTMKGGKTPAATGKIISTDFDGQITSPGGKEDVVDHFHVQADAGDFALGGDSGAIVFLGDQLLGVVRAADEKLHIAVVSRMDVVRLRAKPLGFSL